MRRAAFTVVELMVTVSILLVLYALCLPLIVRAKEAAQVSSSLQGLRQVRMAVAVYQADQTGGEHEFDTLPGYAYVYSTYLGLGDKAFRSACGYRGIEPNGLGLTVQYAFDRHEETLDYYRRQGGQAAVFTDSSCNPSPAYWHSPVTLKRGLMVTLDGNAVVIMRRESPELIDWWKKP